VQSTKSSRLSPHRRQSAPLSFQEVENRGRRGSAVRIGFAPGPAGPEQQERPQPISVVVDKGHTVVADVAAVAVDTGHTVAADIAKNVPLALKPWKDQAASVVAGNHHQVMECTRVLMGPSSYVSNACC